MRLDELTRLRLDDAFYVLEDKGYRRIGQGSYAWVWAKPGADTVLKVFTATDYAYREFANAVMGTSNPHFPRLFGKMIRVNDDYRAIRMERLQPCTRTNVAYRAIQTYLRRDDVGGDASDDVEQEIVESLFGKFPQLKEACDLVFDLAYQEPHRPVIDMHAGNIMLRGDVPVLIDPLS